MAWNAARGRIYATANSDTGGVSQSMFVINPTTATIEQTVSLGQSTDPTSIVLSDDGNFAYIVDSISNQVLQVDLGTLTVTERVQIPIFAVGLKTVPGAPGSFAVKSSNSSPRCSFTMEQRRGPKASRRARSERIFSTRSAPTQARFTRMTRASPRRCTNCQCRTAASHLLGKPPMSPSIPAITTTSCSRAALSTRSQALFTIPRRRA